MRPLIDGVVDDIDEAEQVVVGHVFKGLKDSGFADHFESLISREPVQRRFPPSLIPLCLYTTSQAFFPAKRFLVPPLHRRSPDQYHRRFRGQSVDLHACFAVSLSPSAKGEMKLANQRPKTPPRLECEA
jgi:hypothetical protein